MASIKTAQILIADDRAAMRDLLKGILNNIPNFGPSYLEAWDGDTAVELFKKHRPDIVYLDINMPKLDGLTALKQMLYVDANAFVVMVSGASTVGNVKQAVTAGAKGFIAKPYTAKKIADVLERLKIILPSATTNPQENGLPPWQSDLP